MSDRLPEDFRKKLPDRYLALTRGHLRSKLHYDEFTGVFTWKVRPAFNSRKHPGDVAGNITNTGHRLITIDRKVYSASQLAWFYMTGRWPRGTVGHKNKKHADDSFSNLFEKCSGGRGHDLNTPEGRRAYRDMHHSAHPEKRLHYHLTRRYGISFSEYEEMLRAQGGGCAICGGEPLAWATNGAPKQLGVDHCHSTGMLRGVLCDACNCMIGFSKDHPLILEAGARYLRLHAARAECLPEVHLKVAGGRNV